MSKAFSFELFHKMPLIGIMRGFPLQHMEIIAKKYLEAGLTCLEITMNSADAEKSISSLVKLYGDDLNIGAGTVCSMHDLDKAIAAGAQFIVTPIIKREVIKRCASENLPIFPGAYTPSEIYKAWELGAPFIKLFPSGNSGPGYMKEVLAPLNFVKLIPTGGITMENFTQYLSGGASGVGLGSHLFPKSIIQNEDWGALGEVFSQFVKRYNEYKLKVNK